MFIGNKRLRENKSETVVRCRISEVKFVKYSIHHYQQTFTKWEMSTQYHISGSEILFLLLIFLKENRTSVYDLG